MAQYRVLQKSFVNDRIAEEGAIIDLPDGAEVSDNLELILEVIEEVKPSTASNKA